MTTGQYPAAAPVEVAGIANLAVRDLLHGRHQAGHVLAVVQDTIIAEFLGVTREPRVIAISAPDAVRLTNAIIASIPAGTPTATVTTITTTTPTAAYAAKASKSTKRFKRFNRRTWPAPAAAPSASAG